VLDNVEHNIGMFEEVNKSVPFMCPREKAMLRQCRLMREMSKDSQVGGCPCDGPEDCGFIDVEGRWFPDIETWIYQLGNE
jgi:hypothetical protein